MDPCTSLKEQSFAYTDDEEPEMDCLEIAESYEEAQKTMQYRNHLPKASTTFRFHPSLISSAPLLK